MERDAPFPEPVVYSLFHIPQSPQLRSCPIKEVENIQSPSTEPHLDGRLIYSGVWPVSLRGIIYDTAVSTAVPCSLRYDAFHLGLGRLEPRLPPFLVVTLYSMSPPPTHMCYCLPHDPGYGSSRNPEVPMRGWIYGRHLSVFLLVSVWLPLDCEI